MKQLLLVLMTITLVSLMIVEGAFAAFSDTERSTGNSITAGAELMEYQGLTHGFWKNHTDLWENYSSDDLVGEVFTIPGALNELADDTLLEGLNYSGGKGVDGMARNLLLQSIAALLNASHTDCSYPMDENDIVDATNDALATLDRGGMEALKDEIETNNKLGGAIDAHGRPIK